MLITSLGLMVRTIDVIDDSESGSIYRRANFSLEKKIDLDLKISFSITGHHGS